MTDKKNTELLKDIIAAAEDRKAENITVIDISEKTSFADYFVILTGNSDRQVVAIADNILKTLRNKKIKPMGVEGYEVGLWALLDYGDVLVHIFQPEVRSYYDLEGFWADADRIKPDELTS